MSLFSTGPAVAAASAVLRLAPGISIPRVVTAALESCPVPAVPRRPFPASAARRPAVAAKPGTAVILQMPASAVGVPAAGKALRSVRRESAVSAAAEEADRRGASAAAAAAVTAAPAASAPAPVPAAQTRRAGGGGLGAGGDVFVQQGGTLIIQAGSLGVGTVEGGLSSPYVSNKLGGTGDAFGSGIFIQGDETVTLAASSDQPTLEVAGVIADEPGSIAGYTQDGAGALVIGGGTVQLDADNTYTGGTTIGTAATLVLDNPQAAGSGAIVFDPGSLEFTAANAPANAITDFYAGDTIRIDGFTVAASSYSGGVLMLSGQGGPVDLTIPGLVLSDLTYSNGAGGVTLTTSQLPVCFGGRTRIATPDGERVAESLKRGDRVVALDQLGRPSVDTVRWVGMRTLRLAGHPDPALAAPIRIRAGAFGPCLPARDLRLSPDHCLLMEGHLLRAFRLLNGVSVVQELGRRAITYVHVALDRHALLLAEGILAESYREEGHAAFFSAALASPCPLHDRSPMAACAPFAPDETFAERVWRRVAARAGVASAPSMPRLRRTLTLVAGECSLRPALADGPRQVFAIPPGASHVRLVSPSARPTEARPWVEDRRRLGVNVRRLGVDGTCTLPLDSDAIGIGWWPPEPGPARWTDGDAHVDLPPGSRALEVCLAS